MDGRHGLVRLIFMWEIGWTLEEVMLCITVEVVLEYLLVSMLFGGYYVDM